MKQWLGKTFTFVAAASLLICLVSATLWIHSHFAHDQFVLNLHRSSTEMVGGDGGIYWSYSTTGEYNATVSCCMTLGLPEALPPSLVELRAGQSLGVWPPGQMMDDQHECAGWAPFWLTTVISAMLPATWFANRARRWQHPPQKRALRRRLKTILRRLRWIAAAGSFVAFAAVAALWAASAFCYDWYATWDNPPIAYGVTSESREGAISIESRRETGMQRQLWLGGYHIAPAERSMSFRFLPGFARKPIFSSLGLFVPPTPPIQIGNSLIIPYWSLLLTAAVAPVWLTFRGGRRRFVGRHRRQSGLCPSCGYDLYATTDRCPECGTVPEHPKT